MSGFTGFRPQALAFLRELADNNNAEWFKPRKPVYEAEIKEPLSAFVESFAEKASRRGLPLTGDGRRSVFRIYRDTRFAHDKQPYNTTASAALTRSGARHEPGVLYLHIEPARSFLACGFWRPDGDFLERWRRNMSRNPAAFVELAAQLLKGGHPMSGGELLKRLPRGFESARDSEIAPYLLWKSFIVNRPLSDQELESLALVDHAVRFASDCRPLLEFGWEIAGDGRGSHPASRRARA